MMLAGGADWKGFAQALAAIAPSASSARSRGSLIKLQHRHESLLRDLDRAYSLHPSLAFLLPLQQFAFPGHVPAVALCKAVFSHCGARLARADIAPERDLKRGLVQRDLVLDHDPVAWPVFEVLERPAALLAELHHRPHISGWSDDGQLHVGLCDGFDHRGIRQQRRVVNLDYPATFQLDAILDGG